MEATYIHKLKRSILCTYNDHMVEIWRLRDIPSWYWGIQTIHRKWT